LQWLQDPNQSNADNLNIVRCEVSAHFRKKRKAFLKAKFDELKTNSKIKNIRSVYRVFHDLGHNCRR